MDEAVPIRFGVLLRQHRLAAGLTQEALAERAGVSAKAVSELERDPDRQPRLDTVSLIAEALGLDATERSHFLQAARPVSVPDDARLDEGPRHDLPRPLTPLFGRAGVVEAVAAELHWGTARLLTLTGPGGVGKTRVAIAAAERTAATFADGAAFVDLAPLPTADLVLPAIARRLGVDERHPEPLAERLAAALHRQQLLLVLDNVEHLLPARDDVLALLAACPRLVVLVTSRAALRVRGEREYRVAPLELPAVGGPATGPAVQFFLDRAQAVGIELTATAANLDAVAAICRRLDGLPLAIELVAAWTRILAPPVLLARLDQRLSLLVGGPHDLPARQRTMRDTIAWSYDLLDAGEQHFFRGLCVFVGGCTVDAVGAVCGEGHDERAVLSGLAALVDRSLMQHGAPDAGEPRVTMLETVREFGLEQIEAHGEAVALRRQHAAWFLNLAETTGAGMHGPAGITWRARLEREHGNLRAALTSSLAQHDGATALRLVAALWLFWTERGYLDEGRRWLREALDLTSDRSDGDQVTRVQALVGAATLASDQGDQDEAERRSSEAVALARAQAMPAFLVAALVAHGRAARERGAYEEAAHRYAEALALARATGDPHGEAVALSGLAYATGFLGDLAEAMTLAERSVLILREEAAQRDLAAAIIGLCGFLTQTGDYDRVEELGSEALALLREWGDTGRVADLLWILGLAALNQQQYARAVALHEENLALRRARGDQQGAAEPMSALAGIALQQGDYVRAGRLLEETLVVLQRVDNPWLRSLVLVLHGHVALATGDLERAVGRFTEGAALMQAIGNPLYVGWCLEGLAGVAVVRARWELAAQLCGARDAHRARLGLGMPPADPNMFERAVARTRQTLGEGAYAIAHAAGQTLPPDQAIVEAIGITLLEVR